MEVTPGLGWWGRRIGGHKSEAVRGRPLIWESVHCAFTPRPPWLSHLPHSAHPGDTRLPLRTKMPSLILFHIQYVIWSDHWSCLQRGTSGRFLLGSLRKISRGLQGRIKGDIDGILRGTCLSVRTFELDTVVSIYIVAFVCYENTESSFLDAIASLQPSNVH